MKFTDKRVEKERFCFKDLLRGATFVDDDGDICIKVDDPQGEEYFAVVLKNGLGFSPCDDALVTPIDTELIIYGTK